MYCGALNEKRVQNKGDLPRWLRVVKNPPANAGDAGDTGLITGLGRSPGEGMATHSSVLAWEIPWTEESGRLQSMELQSQIGLSN